MARDGVHKGLIFHLEDESLLQLEKQITILEETEARKQVSFNIHELTQENINFSNWSHELFLIVISVYYSNLYHCIHLSTLSSHCN